MSKVLEIDEEVIKHILDQLHKDPTSDDLKKYVRSILENPNAEVKEKEFKPVTIPDIEEYESNLTMIKHVEGVKEFIEDLTIVAKNYTKIAKEKGLEFNPTYNLEYLIKFVDNQFYHQSQKFILNNFRDKIIKNLRGETEIMVNEVSRLNLNSLVTSIKLDVLESAQISEEIPHVSKEAIKN